MTQKVCAFADDDTNGSPNFNATAGSYGEIQNRMSRLIFQGPTVPSFTLETSMRTRNTGSYNASATGSEAAPGSASDNKQLTRIWRGCKVKDFAIAADADAEVVKQSL